MTICHSILTCSVGCLSWLLDVVSYLFCMSVIESHGYTNAGISVSCHLMCEAVCSLSSLQTVIDVVTLCWGKSLLKVCYACIDEDVVPLYELLYVAVMDAVTVVCR